MKSPLPFSFALFLLVLFTAQPAHAQGILDAYVRQGLDSNLALRQQTFDIRRAELDLSRAKALFYPNVSFNAQYSLAGGGRTMDIPLGDLLNDVYSSLNQLISSTKFPQVQNQEVQFLPNDFHDTRIELTLPVYNPSLGYNKKITEEMIRNREAAVNGYKRELVLTIKQAYFQYLQAEKSVQIYTNALSTVLENLRFNEKLVKHNAATKEVVLKAKAQVSQVQTSLANAEQNRQNAIAYFNFLINRPLQSPVQADSSVLLALQEQMLLAPYVPANREELQQLKSSQKVLENNLKLNDTYKLPSVNGFYNVGFQGFGYKFDQSQFYQVGGLQLSWNIFQGNGNKAKSKQAQLDIDRMKVQYAETEQQLLLQVTTVYNTYRAAIDAMRSAADEVASTREVYRLTESRYRLGQALLLELTDARTQMTSAEIQLSLAQLAVLNKAAELERALATYPIN